MNENYFQIMYPRDCNYIIYWEYLKKWMIDVCWVFFCYSWMKLIGDRE